MDNIISNCDSCKRGHANLDNIVNSLLNQSRCHQAVRRKATKPLPSQQEIIKMLDLLKGVIFPKCYGPENVDADSLKFHMGSILDRIYHVLKEQLHRGYCFQCDGTKGECDKCELRANSTADKFLERIPEIAKMMNSDVHATYIGDPAALDEDEVIFCYPGIAATLYYRIAHELYRTNSPIIARIITEYGHNVTGVDIHPGARIEEGFMIDHGTGVVIGETCEIGKNVRIYQGVTLGAKSFPLDENGNPIKGIKRHPKIEDDVIIYSGATILGDITIGKGSVIGGNVWLTESVQPGTKVMQERYRSESFTNGGGI